MREEILNIINKYDEIEKHDYYCSSYVEIKDYILKKISSPIFKNQNAKKLVDNLDLLLKYTNQTNYDWLFYKIIYEQPHFISKFASSLKYYKFPQNISDLFNKIAQVKSVNEIFTDEMIDSITMLKEEKEVIEILRMMDINSRLKYYEKCIKENRKVIIFSSRLNLEELNFIEFRLFSYEK